MPSAHGSDRGPHGREHHAQHQDARRRGLQVLVGVAGDLFSLSLTPIMYLLLFPCWRGCSDQDQIRHLERSLGSPNSPAKIAWLPAAVEGIRFRGPLAARSTLSAWASKRR
jgi:hypothetical protein